MTTVTDAPEEVEPFHIVYGDNDQGSTMNIGICINSPLSDFILNNKIDNPHLLVVIRQNGNDVVRKLVRLTAGFVHVTFPRPGNYTAYIMVVYPGWNCSLAQMKRVLLEKDTYGGYSQRLFNGHNNDEPFDYFVGNIKNGRDYDTVNVKRVEHFSTGAIAVSEGNFAKPPAKWRTTIVRWFFADNDRDQCHFRRRSLWSIPLFLFALPLHYLIKAIGLVLFGLFGWVYGLNPKPAWKPFRQGSLSMIFGEVKVKRTAWYYKRVSAYEYKPRSAWWSVPFTVAVIELLVSAFVWSVNPGLSWFTAIVNVVSFSLVVAGAIAILFGSVYLILDVLKLDKRLVTVVTERGKRKKTKRGRTELERLTESLTEMSCEAQGQPMTIQQLQKRRRFNPVVVYHSTKDAVCKPFAR